jgi:hypothetical protein
VSPSLRRRVHIALSPRRALAAATSTGLRPRLLDQQAIECAPGASAAVTWEPALEALRTALESLPRARAHAVVTLSNHFVQYLLLPWKQEIVSDEEETAFAAARFAQVYGASAQSAVLRVARASAGKQRVASAIERPLLQALGDLLAEFQLRAESIQPHLMSAVNAWGLRRLRDSWVTLAEPGMLVLGLRRNGDWISLRSRPLEPPAQLAAILEQERRLLGLDAAPVQVFLHQADGAVLDTTRVNAVQLPAAGRLRAAHDAQIPALALGGVA